MTKTSENNKRIAKNTIFLYIRMVFVMCIGLFTSRIVLENLGINDYGIYNVVGGVVALFSFVSMSMTNASSRFISKALGIQDKKLLQETFNAMVTIHILLSLVIVLVAELIGPWFILNKLVIPSDRIVDAMWVFQCSLFTLAFSIFLVPFNALIISHERMNVFAVISIMDHVAKLGVAYLIILFNESYRLKIYAIFLAMIQVGVLLAYLLYSIRNFREGRFSIFWSKNLSMQILKFAGWTLNGNLAVILYTQGLNILLNIFFGPSVNAARGLSVQVQGAVKNFYMSIQTALNPQIIKSYARDDLSYMHNLIIYGSKASFFLIYVIVLPILYNTSFLLGLWLKSVPLYTVGFVQIMLCICLINTLGNLLSYGVHATGDLRRYQLIEGSLLLTILPVSCISLKIYHNNPIQVFWIYLIIELITQVARIIIVCPQIKLKIKVYVYRIIFPIVGVCISSIPLSYLCMQLLSRNMSGFPLLILGAILIELVTIPIILTVGLSKGERSMILRKITNIRIIRIF